MDDITQAPDGRPADVQPAWRRDFPIDSANDQYLWRRDFIKFLVLTSLAFAVGQVWIGASDWLRRRRGQPAGRRIARVSDVAVGGALLFQYPAETDPCMLLRLSETEFVAFSQKCTHLSCAVIPEIDKQRLRCPCHEGIFDLRSGRPTAGPPRRPLPEIQIQVRDGAVYATGLIVRAV